MTNPDWRDIPGYDGAYQINRMGEVRCWKWRGRRTKSPHLLTQYRKKPLEKGHRSGRYYFKLTSPDGKAREIPVLGLMVDVWLGGRPPGKLLITATVISQTAAYTTLHFSRRRNWAP